MKKKLWVVALVLITLAIPYNLIADTKVGISPAVVLFSIDDPDGDTDTFTGVQPIGITIIHDLNNKYRLMTNINIYEFDVDASTSNIGQDVEGYQLGVSIQRMMRLARHLNFYAGVGAAYSDVEFTLRHLVDSDGFLTQQFPDRDESYFSLMANITKEFTITEHIEIGADISYQHSFGDGVSGLKATVGLLYKF